MLDDATAPRRLVLPPPYRAQWLSSGDACAEAVRLAPDSGAGTLVWHASTGSGRAGRFDFAVVLEPEMPLAEARRALVVGMVALGDALAAHCPPERAVSFGWPGQISFDKGRLGGMRLVHAPAADETAVPDWMVLGIELIADRDHLTTPGAKPGSVSLKEEGFADPAAILESFASYLMLNFDRWTHEGFPAVANRYAERLSPAGRLNADGDLAGEHGTSTLAEALRTDVWRDTEGPRL